jgi:hypothetical protein
MFSAKKGSSEITYPSERPGKKPNLLSSGKM